MYSAAELLEMVPEDKREGLAMDMSIYSDLHKDVYGFRPRSIQFESVEDFDRDFDALAEILKSQLERKNKRQAKAVEDFEASIKNMMDIVVNCKTRQDAIRLIAVSYDIDNGCGGQDWNFLELELDVPYGYIAKDMGEYK